MEEIIVTASARETTVMDIPYNISAVSGDDLEQLRISNETDLLRSLAGATVVDRGYRNSGTVNSIVVRGVNVDNGTNGDNALNAIAPVATYINNTPIYSGFIIRDLERVELLRGPQGTLYGSGSLSGTVRYITKLPNTDGIEAEVFADWSQTEYSDGNNQNFDGMINLPLGETVAIRAHAGRIDNDGIVDYINAYQLNQFGEPLIDDLAGNCIDPRSATDQQVLFGDACYEERKDADTVEINYGRVALGWEPTDALSFVLAYQVQEEEVGARRSITLGDNNQNNPDPLLRNPRTDLYFQYGSDDNGSVALEESERDVNMASLDIEWDLGFATLTSATAQFEDDGNGFRDNGGLWQTDAVSGGVAPILYNGWARPIQRTESGYENETFVQELRLVSNASENSSVDWVVGAFYLDEDKVAFNNSFNPGLNLHHQACVRTADPRCGVEFDFPGNFPFIFLPYVFQYVPPGEPLPENDFRYVRNTDFSETAIYGEVAWHVSDRMTLTGGLRWFDNEQTTGGIAWPDCCAVLPVTEDTTASDDGVLFKANLAYDINDTSMVYGTISQGYRRGGVNQIPDAGTFAEPNPDAIRSFTHDEVTNYEIGYKGGTGTMAWTISGYYMDWKDPILNTTTVAFGFLYAQNGDEASSRGIELELNGVLGDSFRYSLGYAYNKAELEADFFKGQDDSLAAESGSKLPSVPESTFSVALDNTWDVGSDASVIAQVTGYYQDDSLNDIDQSSPIAQTHDSFFLLGASVTAEWNNWHATLYGTNLTNEEAITSAFPHYSFDTGPIYQNWYGNANQQDIGLPRTWGLRIGYRF